MPTAQEIVHRDLKPANVMMAAGGEPVVMDFGLAKRVVDVDPNEAKLTCDGGLLGTPSYMAPEQCRGEASAVGPATDVYSLGVMLFEMLTGKTPYTGAMGVVIGQILTAPAPPVKEFRPDVDPRLDAICRKAMAKSPAERFPSMAALANVLGFYLKAPSSPPPPLPTPPTAAVYIAPASPPVSLSDPSCQRQLKIEGRRESGYDAFFSYSSKDVDVAMALVAALEDKGVRCWVAPRDISPGKEWGESIIEGIERSGAFVLIFSTHANVSRQVFREVERAIAKGIPVIPFRIEDVPPSKELEYFISAEHWLEAYAPPVLRHAIHLENAILRLTGGSSRATEGGERRPKRAEAGPETPDAKQTMTDPAGASNTIIAGKEAPAPAPASKNAQWRQVAAAAYRRQKWPLIAGVAACLLLAGLAVLWAAGVFRVKTQDGTIVVENLPTDAEVFVDGEKVALKLTDDDKPIEIQVAPGKRKLEIKTAGFKMETQEVTLASGERKPIGIRLEPLAAASEKPAPPTLPKIEDKDFVPLFNGKDLTGWKTHPSQPGNWRVENGILTGSSDGVSELYTNRGDYTDFHLRLEARLNVGNGFRSTGVYFRALFGPNIPADKPTWVSGYNAKIDAKRLGGLLIDMNPELHRTREPVLRPGEWITCEIIAEGNHVVIKVNGETTSDYTDERRLYTKGHIVLQQHGAATVEFRKIEIRELPATKTEAVPAADDIENDEAQIAKLKQVLLSHTWFYYDNLYPPGSTCRFNPDGIFHDWKWQYWVVGSRTFRVQYDRNNHNKETGVLFTFNQELDPIQRRVHRPEWEGSQGHRYAVICNHNASASGYRSSGSRLRAA